MSLHRLERLGPGSTWRLEPAISTGRSRTTPSRPTGGLSCSPATGPRGRPTPRPARLRDLDRGAVKALHRCGEPRPPDGSSPGRGRPRIRPPRRRGRDPAGPIGIGPGKASSSPRSAHRTPTGVPLSRISAPRPCRRPALFEPLTGLLVCPFSAAGSLTRSPRLAVFPEKPSGVPGSWPTVL